MVCGSAGKGICTVSAKLFQSMSPPDFLYEMRNLGFLYKITDLQRCQPVNLE